MKNKKNKKNKSVKKTILKGFKFRQPIAVVRIKRCGKWCDILWVHTDDHVKRHNIVIAEELGMITGIQIEYLNKDLKG